MSAAGRVCTGFSNPFVALYSNTGSTITYTSGTQLARGVEVSIEASSSDDNSFYADNTVAESAAGAFSGGTMTLTVDGLLDAAEKLIFGLPAAETDGSTHYGDSMSIPYVGVGFIARYMSDGVASYVAYIIPKCRFSVGTLSAKTQEDSIDWQTQELSASIVRDDSANHDWRIRFAAESTEAAALAKIKTALNID